jgi:hypothetical protein
LGYLGSITYRIRIPRADRRILAVGVFVSYWGFMVRIVHKIADTYEYALAVRSLRGAFMKTIEI